ncbi:MAG TPA: cytochrome c-type biogenesis protein CcmH [Thermoanaerobaculia bacterium]
MITTLLLLLLVGQPLSGPALDVKTNEVASLLRCPVCQGMSVADSPSEMAVNMKHQVREMLARGDSKEQILESFERSYGQFVLLKPKFKGVNSLVWLLPIVAIGIGVFVISRTISRRRAGHVIEVEPVTDEVSASRALRSPLWIALVAALVAVGAWYAVQPKAAVEAQEPKPQPESVVVDPAKQLEATIRQSPDNLEARIALAKLYFDRNNMMGVFDQTQYVLDRSPDDSRALTYQAFVRIAMGQPQNAAKLLARATAADPGLTDAWIGIAWIKTEDGLPAEAQAAIAEAGRRHPEERERLARVYADMKQRTQRRDGG